jgi:hypothetical protein
LPSSEWSLLKDLAKLAYSGDRSRMENDLRGLLHQGLAERRESSVLKKESRQVLTLTKQGERLVRRQRFVPEDQAANSSKQTRCRTVCTQFSTTWNTNTAGLTSSVDSELRTLKRQDVRSSYRTSCLVTRKAT